VLRHALYIYSQYRKLVASIQRNRPDVAILIDFPEVNFRLARHLKRLAFRAVVRQPATVGVEARTATLVRRFVTA